MPDDAPVTSATFPFKSKEFPNLISLNKTYAFAGLSVTRSMGPDSANRINVPIGASKPAATNTGTYEKWSTIQPVLKIKIIEPMPAPVPPKPATEATALSEKKSLGSVCTLLIQTWNPKSTTPINASATIASCAKAAKIPAGINNAAITITCFRAWSTLQPRAIKKPDNQPPERLPASAATYGTHANRPIFTREKPRASARYFGSQLMYSHQTGSVMKRPRMMAHTCL